MMEPDFIPFTGPGGGGLFTGDFSLQSLDTGFVQECFAWEGCLIFRPSSCSLSEFVDFTERFSRGFIENPGQLRDVVGEQGTLQTVNRSMEPLPLHSEMTYLPHPLKPEILWLYCEKPALSGGETNLCDGRVLAEFLLNSAWADECTRSVRYRKVYGPYAWQKFSGVSEKKILMEAFEAWGISQWFRFKGDLLTMNHVVPILTPGLFGGGRNFVTQIIHDMIRARKKPIFSDGSLVGQAFFQALRNVSQSMMVTHQWREGDVIMVDNSRFLHGRAAQDSARKIRTRISYANFGAYGNSLSVQDVVKNKVLGTRCSA